MPHTSPVVNTPPSSWRDRYPVHPCADVFPMMADDQLDTLAQDIKDHGLHHSIVLYADPRTGRRSVLDGRNRLEAMVRAGFDPDLNSAAFETVSGNAVDASGTVDPATLVISQNIRRRHLTKEQQAELILKTIEAGRIDSATPARSFNPSNGKKGGSTKDAVLEKAVTEAEKHGISKRTVQNARARLQGKPASPAHNLSVHFSSDSAEHLSPPHIIEAARLVLGPIDLDPCSNDQASPNVPATQHFTKAGDGLRHDWCGTVYLNPPYGRDIDQWIAKLVADYERRNRVTAAIALVPARPDTDWWRTLRKYWCCFLKGRLTFGGNTNPAPFPSAVFYLGKDHRAFHRAFSPLGDIWQCVLKEPRPTMSDEGATHGAP